MDTVREFVRRLQTVTPNDARLRLHHRRLILPTAALFSLQGTIFRTYPIEPIHAIKRPGSQLEASQLLEWRDTDGEQSGGTPRDNDLGVDLAAILALACGRKVQFANEFPVKYASADWTWFLEIGHIFDGELYGPIEGDVHGSVTKILKAIMALSERPALSLGSAIRMRNAACCLVEADHSSAYGLLVAAIETLSRGFGSPPNSWEDWDKSEEWDAFMREIALTEEQATRLRARLITDRQIRLRRTFIEYAASRLSNSFWQEPYRTFEPGYQVSDDGVTPKKGSWRDDGMMSQLLSSDRVVLRQRLGKSYDARSVVFHESVRLAQVSVLPFPRTQKDLLPFRVLRRILDHILWLEIQNAASRDVPLPDVRLFHPGTDLAEA
jgi:hypothetical protein